MKILGLLLGACACCGSLRAAASLYDVRLDFADLTSRSNPGLMFSLNDGGASAADLTSVTLSDFTVTGGAFGDPAITSGAVTGDPANVFTLSTTGGGDASWMRIFSAGVTSIAFRVEITTTLASAATPDEFRVFAFDDNEIFPTDGAQSEAAFFSISGAPAGVSAEAYAGDLVTARVTAVPEPSAYGWGAAGVVAGLAFVRRRARRA